MSENDNWGWTGEQVDSLLVAEGILIRAFRELWAERDKLKAENDKLKAEIADAQQAEPIKSADINDPAHPENARRKCPYCTDTFAGNAVIAARDAGLLPYCSHHCHRQATTGVCPDGCAVCRSKSWAAAPDPEETAWRCVDCDGGHAAGDRRELLAEAAGDE